MRLRDLVVQIKEWHLTRTPPEVESVDQRAKIRASYRFDVVVVARSIRRILVVRADVSLDESGRADCM